MGSSHVAGGTEIPKLLPWTESFGWFLRLLTRDLGRRWEVKRESRVDLLPPAAPGHISAEQNSFDFFYILTIPCKILKNNSIFF